MENLVESLREIVGTPEFYVQLPNVSEFHWDYGAMFEYMFACVLLCIVVGSVFKFLRCLLK